ncbi:MAG: sigma 54-interacting transcriptional regulator [Fibrobacter sp.]|nr:sigma 54-interacting transcriptional regulator [Fibrobacter sp.]
MFNTNKTVLYEMLKSVTSKAILLESTNNELKAIWDECKSEWGAEQQTLFNKSENALIVVDENLNVRKANPKVPDEIGFQPYQLIGKMQWLDIVCENSKTDIVDYHKRLSTDSFSVFSYDVSIIDNLKNKRELQVKAAALPINGWHIIAFADVADLNEVERAISSGTIVDWKHKEDELADIKYRFKETADLLPGIICEFDMNFNLTYVNLKGLATFGMDQDDFKRGINVFEVIPPDQQEKFEKDIYNIFHGDYGNPAVYQLYKKDKSVVHVLINAAPIIRNNNLIGMRTCIIDISDRVNAEKKLQVSEQRFRTIFTESPIGIALFSHEGKCIEKNKSFFKMFDWMCASNTDGDLFSCINLDVSQHAKLKKGESIIHEASYETLVNNRIKKVYYEWHITTLGLDSEEKWSYLVQVRDITEQKEATEARLQKEKEATERAERLIAGLRKELRENATFHNMVSRSPQMKQIFDIIPEVAEASATVLIYGESGTGKELIARSLHELSSRNTKPFIAINCSALPDNLLESELFGYKAGAFTDAKKDKLGKFALAEGGTIFLDEIGDISIAMQVKLLRVLQERVYEPLGGTMTVKANVRVIAATNKDLKEMVNKSAFREDLYYRLNVVNVSLPNLNERRCDIPILCEHFIERFNSRYGKAIKEISRDAMDIILSYTFPGNIRELENVIEHAFIFCKDSVVEPRHLPVALRALDEDNDLKDILNVSNFDELEKMYIKSIIADCNGDRNKAAERLGIHRATLFRKLKQYGLHV